MFACRFLNTAFWKVLLSLCVRSMSFMICFRFFLDYSLVLADSDVNLLSVLETSDPSAGFMADYQRPSSIE